MKDKKGLEIYINNVLKNEKGHKAWVETSQYGLNLKVYEDNKFPYNLFLDESLAKNWEIVRSYELNIGMNTERID